MSSFNSPWVHTQSWEVCSASRTVKEVWPRICESIEAAQKLGLTWVSLTTERNDHFMHGGNVSKGRCVKYTLTVRSGVPPLAEVFGSDRQDA